MNEKDFFYHFYDLKDKREKQISDIYSILLKFEKEIIDYKNQDNFNKWLINNLLTHSIVISVSSFQWFLEDIIYLLETYILDNKIEISKLDKNIYDLVYKKYSNRIIRDYLIYWEKIKVNELWEFISKNNFGNLKLKNWTSNTLNYSNIQEIMNFFSINFSEIIKNININIEDYNFISWEQIWEQYTLNNEKKEIFFKAFIKKLTNSRHEIVHWKNINILNKEEIYKLFLVTKKYLFNKALLEIELYLKKYIREKKFKREK